MENKKSIRTKEDYEILKQEAHSMFQAGVMQKDIAKALDVSTNSVSDWKRFGGWKVKSDEGIENDLDTLVLLIAQVKNNNELLYKKLIQKVVELKQKLKSKKVIK